MPQKTRQDFLRHSSLQIVVVMWCLAATWPQGADAAPTVPGFERFYAAEGADLAQGGQLLLGELNCTSCHQTEKSLDVHIHRKQAPLLDAVGSRVTVAHLRATLSDPHAVKAGTTMPDLLAGRPEAERKAAIEALVHFLAATGSVSHAPSQRKWIAAGGKLYHQVGCVACHGPRPAEGAPLATSMPLGDLSGKYTIPSLAAFLQEPLKARPSGRMPGLNLKPEEARDIAHFLLPEAKFGESLNLAYRYYEGSWDRLPEFDKLQPKASGKSSGFDVSVSQRDGDFALRFDGYLKIDAEGEYTFRVTSDDGSRLWIGGKLVVDNDGIHSSRSKEGKLKLTVGMHPLTAAVFNGGGGVELEIEFHSATVPKQPLTYAMFLTPEAPKGQPATDGGSVSEGPFVLDPTLIKQGRELFATLGCAGCHTMSEDKKRIESKLAAPPLVRLNATAGCLADRPPPGVPQYRLSAAQQGALAASIKRLTNAPVEPPSAKERLAHTLTTFNCYACHDRDQVGGVEEARNKFFETNQKEMGDEGRIPPSLNGVGAKLTPSWLKQLFANGAQDRPYMLTRMPKFGDQNLGHAIADLAALDTIEPVTTPEFNQSLRRVKSDGRHLVGNEALGCIKCHNFKNEKATGIQAMNMTTMTARLKHDWFHRYMLNPQQFRPGTRMPSAWPNGQTFYKDLLEGSVAKQIEAVWLYLADGDKAAVPYGLGRQPIPLVAANEAVMYRNFLQGAGPRGIAVGYPEKANLAFDANEMRLAIIWQGAFIDAGKHWLDRGAGFQTPLGDNVLHLPAGPAFAVLVKPDDAWPTTVAKQSGYTFRGYRLDSQRRPTFLYDYQQVRIEDFPIAVVGQPNPGLVRTLTLTAEGDATKDLYFRAAAASKIEPASDGWYVIDDEWRLRVEGGGDPRVRESGKQYEILIPVLSVGNQRGKIVQQFQW